MSTQPLTPVALERALHLRDLTDPQYGPHAMQIIVGDIHRALARAWRCPRYLHRCTPVVPVEDNYDRLGYPADAAARAERYTRYVSARYVLRTQMSAVIPQLLSALSLSPPEDVLLVCPGLVYRRDVIDRLHTGEPHQLDLWRVARGSLTTADLEDMIARVVEAALPGSRYRVAEASHPYTTDGLEIEVEVEGGWVEIGECGLASPDVLSRCGLDPRSMSGLAMGLGLDRTLMIRKQIDDIRLIRAEDPRISEQMLSLDPYVVVSNQPPIRRDLSIVIDAELSDEALGDRIRALVPQHLDCLESVEVGAVTAYGELHPNAQQRLGLTPDQKNALVRLVIRHPVRTLTSDEANAIRNDVYRAVHEGPVIELA